jgi:hypothetical protein
MSTVYFITHPDVVIDPSVPVPRWPLSPRGRMRMTGVLEQQWASEVRAIYCSTEQKAIDGAAILSEALGVPYTAVPALGENDRSATGYLPGPEFDAVVSEFFRQPEESVRGWERAIDAQSRIVAATMAVLRTNATRRRRGHRRAWRGRNVASMPSLRVAYQPRSGSAADQWRQLFCLRSRHLAANSRMAIYRDSRIASLTGNLRFPGI